MTTWQYWRETEQKTTSVLRSARDEGMLVLGQVQVFKRSSLIPGNRLAWSCCSCDVSILLWVVFRPQLTRVWCFCKLPYRECHEVSRTFLFCLKSLTICSDSVSKDINISKYDCETINVSRCLGTYLSETVSLIFRAQFWSRKKVLLSPCNGKLPLTNSRNCKGPINIIILFWTDVLNTKWQICLFCGCWIFLYHWY